MTAREQKQRRIVDRRAKPLQVTKKAIADAIEYFEENGWDALAFEVYRDRGLDKTEDVI